MFTSAKRLQDKIIEDQNKESKEDIELVDKASNSDGGEVEPVETWSSFQKRVFVYTSNLWLAALFTVRYWLSVDWDLCKLFLIALSSIVQWLRLCSQLVFWGLFDAIFCHEMLMVSGFGLSLEMVF